MKKVLGFLASVLAFFAFSCVCYAESGTYGSFTWQTDNGVLTISGSGVFNSGESWTMDGEEVSYVEINHFFDESVNEIVFSEGVEEIASQMFPVGEWSSIAKNPPVKLVLPSTLKKVGDGTFRYLNVPELDLPENITYIGDNAFEKSTAINLKLSENTEYVGENAFNTIKNNRLFIPKSVNIIFWETAPELSEFVVADESEVYSTIDGVLFSKDKSELIKYPAKRGANDYTVPEGTKTIAEEAFRNDTDLKSIIIPDSVTKIGESTFYYNHTIERVVLPNGLKAIPDRMFMGCSSLSEVNIPEALETIGYGAFSDCDSLKALVLHEGLLEIGDSAFEGSGIKSIVVPKSVTKVGNAAFRSGSLKKLIFLDGGAGAMVGTGAFATYGETDILLPASSIYIDHVFDHEFIYTGMMGSMRDNPRHIFEPYEKEAYENVTLYVPEGSPNLERVVKLNEEYGVNFKALSADENIAAVDISEYTESKNCHVEKIINTNYGTVLYFWYIGTPHARDPMLLLVKPDGSTFTLSKPVSKETPWSRPEHENIAISDDGKTLTFSVSFAERSQGDMGSGVFVLHDAGTYYYSSNLETGESVKTRFEPLPVIDEDIISSWAKPEVEKAIELGIVPISFRENYKRNITRGEFARLAMYFLSVQYGYQAEHVIETYYHIGKKLDMSAFMNAYCAVKTDRRGEPFEGGDEIYTTLWNSVSMDWDLHDNIPFTDILGIYEPYYIGMAYNIGIVNGVSETKFDPDGEITRQEAAAMLMRVYRNYADFMSPDIGFRYSDNDKIASWAKEDIYSLYSLGVMKGLSEDVFGVNDNYTIEQAIVTFIRLYELVPVSRKNGNIEPLLDPEFEINKYFERASMYFHEEERMEFEKYTILYGGWTARHQMELDYDLYVFYKNGGMRDLTSFVPIAQSNNDPITDIEVNEEENTITFCVTIGDTFRLYNSLYGAEHVYDIGRYRIKTDLETGNIIDLEYLGKFDEGVE